MHRILVLLLLLTFLTLWSGCGVRTTSTVGNANNANTPAGIRSVTSTKGSAGTEGVTQTSGTNAPQREGTGPHNAGIGGTGDENTNTRAVPNDAEFSVEPRGANTNTGANSNGRTP